MIRKDKFLPTIDDWSPNHPRDTVKCSIFCIPGNVLKRGAKPIRARGKPVYRVCVWGADDLGMDLDFTSQSAAENMYNKLPNPITKKWLKEQGFEYF